MVIAGIHKIPTHSIMFWARPAINGFIVRSNWLESPRWNIIRSFQFVMDVLTLREGVFGKRLSSDTSHTSKMNR